MYTSFFLFAITDITKPITIGYCQFKTSNMPLELPAEAHCTRANIVGKPNSASMQNKKKT